MELRLNFTSEEVEQGLEEDFSSAGLFQDAVFRTDFEVFDPEEAAPDGLLLPPPLSRSTSASVSLDDKSSPRRVRIYHIRIPPLDTLAPADIFIHTGDFTNHGTDGEYALFNEFLGSISQLYSVRVVVLGNHGEPRLAAWADFRRCGLITAERNPCSYIRKSQRSWAKLCLFPMGA